jgi:hypothetical protein
MSRRLGYGFRADSQCLYAQRPYVSDHLWHVGSPGLRLHWFLPLRGYDAMGCVYFWVKAQLSFGRVRHQ